MAITQTLRVKVGHKYEKREVTIYKKSEADEAGIEYVHWKSFEPGVEWLLLDDDVVVPVVRFKPYMMRGELTYRIRMPHGYYATFLNSCKWGNPNKKQHANNAKQELYRKNTRSVLKAYAKLLVEQDGEVTPEQFEKLARIFRNDQKNPVATFKRVLKMKEIKEVVGEELAALLTSRGITKASIVDSYEEIREKAAEIAAREDSIQALNLCKSIVDRYSKMLDMEPKKTTLSARMEYDFNSVVLPEKREPIAQLNGHADKQLEPGRSSDSDGA